MASTSEAKQTSATKQFPNWLEMPHELMVNVFQRLRTAELLKIARKVCTTWRQICKDPALWKVIDVSVYESNANYAVEMQAVDFSRGELIDISIESLCSNDLLDHIVLRASKLKSLCLKNCFAIAGSRLREAVKKVPQLEKLHLSSIDINEEDIKVIGQNCPHLVSLKLNKESEYSRIGNDDDALAIANNMPGLRHLQLFGNQMTDNGLKAILNACPHLESLDVWGCYNLRLGGNLGKLCTERIKDFKPPSNDADFEAMLSEYFGVEGYTEEYYYADMIAYGYDDL